MGSRDPILEFWDPPNISRTVEARNYKFGKEMGLPNISRTVEARNFKFGTQMAGGEL